MPIVIKKVEPVIRYIKWSEVTEEFNVWSDDIFIILDEEIKKPVEEIKIVVEPVEEIKIVVEPVVEDFVINIDFEELRKMELFDNENVWKM